MTIAVTVLAVVVAILAVLVLGLLRSHALVLRRLHDAGLDLGPEPDVASATASAMTAGPRRQAVDDTEVMPSSTAIRPPSTPVGRAAHDVVGVDPRGGAIGIPTTGTDHDTLLLFLSADCTTCQRFWDVLAPGDVGAADDGVRLPDGVRLVVVTKGPEHESPPAIAARPVDVPVVMSDDAWRDFAVPGSPYAVHVDGASGRVVGEGTGASWDQLADLLARATGEVDYVTGGRRRKARRDAVAERDTDAVLMTAGILPGDPSLVGFRESSAPHTLDGNDDVAGSDIPGIGFRESSAPHTLDGNDDVAGSDIPGIGFRESSPQPDHSHNDGVAGSDIPAPPTLDRTDRGAGS